MAKWGRYGWLNDAQSYPPILLQACRKLRAEGMKTQAEHGLSSMIDEYDPLVLSEHQELQKLVLDRYGLPLQSSSIEIERPSRPNYERTGLLRWLRGFYIDYLPMITILMLWILRNTRGFSMSWAWIWSHRKFDLGGQTALRPAICSPNGQSLLSSGTHERSWSALGCSKLFSNLCSNLHGCLTNTEYTVLDKEGTDAIAPGKS